MTQKNIKSFLNEIYSNPPKKNYATNRCLHIDDIWSLDILDLKDYGPENNRGYRYALVIIDNISKYGWTIPIKNKKAITIKDSFENILLSSKRKPNLIESDRRTEFYNNRVHSSTKLTPILTSLKKNEGFVYKNLIDKRNKIKPKFQINDLVRTADLRKTFSKGDTTNWSYKLYKITEIINETIPSYKIDNLKERYNEALLKKTEVTLKENNAVMKKLNLN